MAWGDKEACECINSFPLPAQGWSCRQHPDKKPRSSFMLGVRVWVSDAATAQARWCLLAQLLGAGWPVRPTASSDHSNLPSASLSSEPRAYIAQWWKALASATIFGRWSLGKESGQCRYQSKLMSSAHPATSSLTLLSPLPVHLSFRTACPAAFGPRLQM